MFGNRRNGADRLTMHDARVTLSIVSHRQNGLANQLLSDLARHCGGGVRAVLTQNVPEAVAISTGNLPFAAELTVNDMPKGFGANHNAAFVRCRTPLFGVVNPDVRLESDPLPELARALGDERVGVAGPLVCSPSGAVEDSARVFPTPAILFGKLIGRRPGPDYPVDRGPVEVDWVAGMFMLFRREAFEAVNGFDESYFLYYEDVDICYRLRRAGRSVVFNPLARIVHDARRASHRDPRLALRHLGSALRYLRRRTAG